ncbi:MAG TPA: hypothetical protein VK919_02740 [Solirubrobacterales bacterium]|nr:hypothetical protein [Solirubrobacterales bacterium]
MLVALGTGSAYAAAKITSKDIAKNAVTAKHIRSNAVTTPKLANGAVTKGKLGADARVLWANVENNFGTPSLIRGSGVVGIGAFGTARVRVSFNRSIRNCSYQATGWINTETSGTWVDPPIMNVESQTGVSSPANSVIVQAYSRSTGNLDSDNYDFTLAVFC